jgi:uncharacterized protein YndB with AHSA1/START domain
MNMNTTRITVQTTIAAGLEKVWNYYHAPEHITGWNFASDDWHCPKAENDLQAGGKLKTRMEAKDGSFGFDFEAVYDEVIDQQKIQYTLADGRQSTTEFVPAEQGTTVITTFDAESQNPTEMQREGWQAILSNFKKYVENN